MSMVSKAMIYQLFLLVAFMSAVPANADNAPDSTELLELIGINPAQQGDLKQGVTIPFDVTESGEKELGAGVAMYVLATPQRIIDIVRKGDMASIDTDVIDEGVIMRINPADSLREFSFTTRQTTEAKNFLEAEAGDDFNLSDQEIAMLKKQSVSDSHSLTETASQAYRNILLERLNAYQKSGLKGIAPYSRGDDAASPAEELQKATVNSKVLARYFPDMYQIWLNYPAALPANAEDSFFWLNRKVENRPTAILGHRMIYIADSGALILGRQLYVGHSYNSSQLTVACLPYGEGSLVFYVNRTSTDQVAGMGSGLKHTIGREQMRAEMVDRLKKLQQLVSR